jgi:hypothetical protein
MLSAHCSKVGSAPGVTGPDAPVPVGRRRRITAKMLPTRGDEILYLVIDTVPLIN